MSVSCMLHTLVQRSLYCHSKIIVASSMQRCNNHVHDHGFSVTVHTKHHPRDKSRTSCISDDAFLSFDTVNVKSVQNQVTLKLYVANSASNVCKIK